MYYPNLSYKKMKDGKYAYFPISPMISKAYIVTAEQKAQIQSIQQELMIWLSSAVVLGVPLVKLFSGIGFALSTVLFVSLLAVGSFKKKKVLKGCMLDEVQGISWTEYYYQLAKEKQCRDLKREVVASLIIGGVGYMFMSAFMQEGRFTTLVVSAILFFMSFILLVGSILIAYLKHKSNVK